jgi:site-specific recombinase XerD
MMNCFPQLPFLLEQYRRELLELKQLALETYRIYRTCLEQFFTYCQQELKTDPLQCCGVDMVKWLGELKQRGISNAHLSHYRWALRSFYAFLKKVGLRRDDPAEHLFRIRKNRSEKNQPVLAAEVIRLLKAVDSTTYEGQRDYLMISILWALGLRISELLKLRFKDFKLIDVAEKTALLIIHGKGRKQRALFVVDKLFDYFIAYLNHPKTSPEGMACPFGDTHKQSQGLLFPGKHGNPTDDSTILKRFERYKQAAGLSCRINPHVLRHTFATQMYYQGVPAEAIRAMLGHRSLDETAIYIHVSEQKKQEALSLLTIGGELW